MKSVDYSGKSVSQLNKILWRWFSKYIRLRDSNDFGLGRCISCGKPVQVWYLNNGIRHYNQQAHAGHYYSKSVTWRSLYYDEKNVNLQCCHCNTFIEGHKDGYRTGLIKKYGEEVIDELDLKKSRQGKWPRFAYVHLIEEYRRKVEKLENV